MIIKRIKRISQFGVYKNFRGNLLPDFDSRNVFYGWNYSGKTTLSRVFSFLDKNTLIPQEYQNGDFEIELDNGDIVTKENRHDFEVHIKVFNSDYIIENMHFDSPDAELEGVSFTIGSENIEARNKLSANNARISLLLNEINANRIHIERVNAFEKEFTEISKRIKNRDFASAIEFTRAHFKRVASEMTAKTVNSFVLSDDEIQTYRSLSIAADSKAKLNGFSLTLFFNVIYEEVNSILSYIPTAIQEDELLKDSDLYDWTKHGLSIYASKPRLRLCAFCGNIIDEERVAYLNAFYSNEAAKLRLRIENIKQKIYNEIDIVSNIPLFKYHEKDLNMQYHKRFNELCNAYQVTLAKYIEQLNRLVSVLEEKEKMHLFDAVRIPVLNLEPYEVLIHLIDEANAIIDSHNNDVKNFAELRENSRDILKKHLVAVELLRLKYFTVKANSEKQISENAEKSEEIEKLRSENAIIEAQLRSVAKGCETLNKYIKLFLGREDVRVEVTNSNSFVLKRHGEAAMHLSDGERMAISFSYFITQLESLKEDDKLKDCIIFIDDPISSLDANHMAQVSSLINSFFFVRGADLENPDKIINNFAQLFISTHNFDFYGFVCDATNIKRKINENVGGQKNSRILQRYFIKRVSENESMIEIMPKTLSSYKSEYVYLFSEINKFREDGYPQDRAYSMPNIVRRFLEVYTLTKLPGNRDEIDKRIQILMGDVNELKILHNFSHFTSLERITRHNELILRIGDLIDDLYTLLNKDIKHYESLLEGIK